MYLSGKGESICALSNFVPTRSIGSVPFLLVSEKVSMSLRRKDKPASAGVNDSTSQTIRWFAEGCAGNRQHAYQPSGVYTPLYSMK